MTLQQWRVTVPLVALGTVLIAAWPLSAYTVGPAVMPAALIATGVLVLIANRPEYGIAVVAAIAPWTNMAVGEYQPFRFAIPVLAVGTLVYGLLAARGGSADRPPSMSLGVAALVMAALASSIGASAPSESLTKLVSLIASAALFFAVTQICRERRQLLVVVGGAIAALLFASAQGVLQQLSGQFAEAGFIADGELVNRIEGSFGHPNQYAGFLAVLVPVAAAVAVGREIPRRLRVLAATAAVLAVPALIFSYTRGAILGLVVGSLVWLAVVRPRLVLVVGLITVLMAATVAPAALQDRFRDDSGGDVALRTDLWGASLDIYAQNPVFGVGLNNFKEAYASLPANLPSASQRRLLHQRQVLVPPHANNVYLNVLAELGLFGALAFVLFGGAALMIAYRGTREGDPVVRAVSIGVGAGLVVLAVHGVLEVTFFTELSQPLFALLGAVTGLVARDASAE